MNKESALLYLRTQLKRLESMAYIAVEPCDELMEHDRKDSNTIRDIIVFIESTNQQPETD